MNVHDFYYDLPKELIAQHPSEKREMSRLLVLDRDTGETKDCRFYDVIEMLRPGDCMVLNDTKVIPARLLGRKKESGAKCEVLLLKQLGTKSWECMVRPGKKLRPGTELIFEGCGEVLQARILNILEGGNREIEFQHDGDFFSLLDRLGKMPLPPYITEEQNDYSRYQTVYARNIGSAAAPTAGLHFTEELLHKAAEKGVEICYVTLHIGIGTFRPVKTELVEEHVMHSEWFSISSETAEKINRTRKNGGRVIAVGTTSVRVLESAADDDGAVREKTGDTNIFIYPGYRFRATDCLITNFHLPESTLLMLVSALAGREKILNAYCHAVKEKYKFFSFGDAMLIL